MQAAGRARNTCSVDGGGRWNFVHVQGGARADAPTAIDASLRDCPFLRLPSNPRFDVSLLAYTRHRRHNAHRCVSRVVVWQTIHNGLDDLRTNADA